MAPAIPLRRKASPARHLGRARGEEGSAMVEMAFSITILLTVLIGVIEMALAFYTYNAITESAREGTRFAIVRGSACNSTYITDCPATAAEIQSYVESIFPGLNTKLMTVNTYWCAVGTTCTSSTCCNSPGDQVQVTVQYQYPLAIPFVLKKTIAMTSTAQMVISQ